VAELNFKYLTLPFSKHINKKINMKLNNLLQFSEGLHIKCVIERGQIDDAKLHNQNGEWFICQNIKDGSDCEYKLGYKYSWSLATIQNDLSNGNNATDFETIPDIIENKIDNPVYWECTTDGHKKFWAARIVKKINYPPTGSVITGLTPHYDGTTTYSSSTEYILERKWGAIGTEGQRMEQTFYDEQEAYKKLKELIINKEKEGYKPIF